MAINSHHKVTRLAIALAAFGAFAGLFELAAVATDAYPTISELLWATPVWFRAVVLGLAAAAGVDHFITRKWL